MTINLTFEAEARSQLASTRRAPASRPFSGNLDFLTLFGSRWQTSLHVRYLQLPRPESGAALIHSRRTRRIALSLYHSGFSCREVSESLRDEFGAAVTPQTVARWAGEIGLGRNVGGWRTVSLPPDAGRLYESGLTVAQVGKRFHVSKTAAAERLREMGVTIRPSGWRFLHALTADGLRTSYLVEGRTARSIADETGCSIGTVCRLLRIHGVLRRDARP